MNLERRNPGHQIKNKKFTQHLLLLVKIFAVSTLQVQMTKMSMFAFLSTESFFHLHYSVMFTEIQSETVKAEVVDV